MDGVIEISSDSSTSDLDSKSPTTTPPALKLCSKHSHRHLSPRSTTEASPSTSSKLNTARPAAVIVISDESDDDVKVIDVDVTCRVSSEAKMKVLFFFYCI